MAAAQRRFAPEHGLRVWSAPLTPRPQRTSVPDIFDEVDEELRADRATKLFKRYAGWLLALAVLIVVGAGGWQVWRWYDLKQRTALAESYLAAMRTADSKGAARQQAEAQFAAVAARASGGYRDLALLRVAALKAESGDLAGASALWDQVAGDGQADSLLRDLANLQWALHQIDSGDPALVAARLDRLTAPGNPWRPMAEEAQAMLALRQGKAEAARDALKRVAEDITAPEGSRVRAERILTQLGG